MTLPSRRVFIGIDAGTTGSKTMLFDEHGKKLGSGYHEYECLYPHPGWVEQDIETVWSGICSATRMARAAASVVDAEIYSVALSTQRGTFILLDGAEQPLERSILWNDSRAKTMEAPLSERVAPERFRAITGMPLSGSWSIAKLLWLLKHRPQLMSQVRHICNGQEYLLRRMGADCLESDPSSLTLNGMLDINRLDWSADGCMSAGIDLSLLPPVGKPGVAVGYLSAFAAEQLGLPANTLLCRGGGDQQCAAVGAGVIKQGMAEVTLGTSAMMVAHLDHPSLVTGPSPYIGGHAVAGYWDAEGGAFSIGSCLKWWRDHFGDREQAQARGQGGNAYELLIELARQARAGSDGVIFHPFFAGQVTPYYDTTARGGFLGLGLNHGRASLTRALLEGCACEVKLMVDGIANDVSGGLPELRLTGGAAQSNFYMQLYADILRRPVVLLENHECGTLGAALLGATGSGHFGSVEEAVESMVHVSRTVEPADDVADVYEDLYGIFRRSYEAMAQTGLYQKIYDFQSRYF